MTARPTLASPMPNSTRSSTDRIAVLRRVASGLVERGVGAGVVLLTLATLVFLALRVLPGDVTSLVLGEQADAAERAALRARLGLNQPLWAQYLEFLWALGRLDLGSSLARPGTPAFDVVFAALAPTSSLAISAVGFGAVVGVLAAVLAVGPWLGEARRWVHGVILFASATPLIALAPLLTYILAVRLRVVPLPGDPDAGLGGLFFASGLLAVPLAAQVARITRAALLEQRQAKFLEVARAKGGSALRVWLIHALPPASGPVTVVIASQLGALLGGAVVLERLFERPGLGTLMLSAYAARDLPVLEASVIAAGLLFVVVQALAGAMHAALDPRGGTT
jgi:peptide/nickel transport system permease protein